jgi:hypothetical protein
MEVAENAAAEQAASTVHAVQKQQQRAVAEISPVSIEPIYVDGAGGDDRPSQLVTRHHSAAVSCRLRASAGTVPESGYGLLTDHLLLARSAPVTVRAG